MWIALFGGIFFVLLGFYFLKSRENDYFMMRSFLIFFLVVMSAAYKLYTLYFRNGSKDIPEELHVCSHCGWQVSGGETVGLGRRRADGAGLRGDGQCFRPR